MGLYEGLKDAAKIVQQADNIELYEKLLELSAQALDMRDEITRLNEENAKLKSIKDISEKVERHVEPVITLKGDNPRLFYCAHCWDNEKTPIQVACFDNGTFICPHCNFSGVYDKGKEKKAQEEINNLPIMW